MPSLGNLLLILLLSLAPQSPESYPPLGVIDFYGLHTVSEAQVRQVLGFHEGDAIDLAQLEKEKREAERRITTIPGVKAVFLEFVCCTNDQKSMLYVGIEETNSACSVFQPAPQGNVRLTSDVIRAGSDFEAAIGEAVEKGDAAEDDSQGHALNHNPEVRSVQVRFIILAEAHLANLEDVLRDSYDADQRALAAQVLGYVKDKQSVVPNLLAAMHDPSSGVRNNASRALLVFARFSPTLAAGRIQVSPQPFIEMLNSCIWTDRNKSSFALAELTQQRDAALLAEIRKEALPSLMEMARWKLMGYARPSLMILGRIGGLSDEQIEKDLEAGNREAIIAAGRKATQ